MSQSNLCYGCMREKSSDLTCPYCGWSDNEFDSPLYLSPGTVLTNKYLVGKVLGQGGFGITYLGWDITLDIRVAIKEYFPMGLVVRSAGSQTVDAYEGSHLEQFTYGLESFLSEAKILARFSEHPNIVTVRDFFRANNTAYMVMNYIEGQTLEEHLRQAGGKIDFPQMLEIMMPVMDALREVHQAGFMHRDISPDNIFIHNGGRVVLIDFGAARQDLQSRSRSLSVILKVGYAPEEQYRSRGKQGPWTDIYAVAATIYRGITAERPPESMDRLEEDTLRPPTVFGVEISAVQEQVLLKALEIKAKDRYQSVVEFQRALLVASANQELVEPDDEINQVDSAVSSQEEVKNYVEKKLPQKENSVLVNMQFQDAADDMNPQKPAKGNTGDLFVQPGSDRKPLSFSPKINKTAIIILAALTFLLVGFVTANNYMPVSEIVIEPSELTLVAGEDLGYISFSVKPFFADKSKLIWRIDQGYEKYASVIDFTAIEPKKAGSFKIMVSTEDGHARSSVQVTIINPTIPWNSGIYTGEIEDGLPNGEGVWESESGESYDGQWLDGNYHGYGEWSQADGEEYLGYWENGLFHGDGKHKLADGQLFVGAFIQGLIQGKGTWTHPNGDEYIGEFKDGKKHGVGKYTWSDGSVYEGDFIEDLKHGNGVLISSDGSKTVGEWKNDEYIVMEPEPEPGNKFEADSGSVLEPAIKRGVISYIGGVYTGEYHINKTYNDERPHGKGRLELDGTIFIGDWHEGAFHGKGIIIGANGYRYEGDVVIFHRWGNGETTYQNGNKYIGQYESNKEHGKGKMIYDNGEIYEGMWREGLRHGQGIYTFTDGRVLQGRWVDDEFVGQ